MHASKKAHSLSQTLMEMSLSKDKEMILDLISIFSSKASQYTIGQYFELSNDISFPYRDCTVEDFISFNKLNGSDVYWTDEYAEKFGLYTIQKEDRVISEEDMSERITRNYDVNILKPKK